MGGGGGLGGLLSGGNIGALAGAALGSAIPGVGTVLGGTIGGAAGGLATGKDPLTVALGTAGSLVGQSIPVAGLLGSAKLGSQLGGMAGNMLGGAINGPTAKMQSSIPFLANAGDSAIDVFRNNRARVAANPSQVETGLEDGIGLGAEQQPPATPAPVLSGPSPGAGPGSMWADSGGRTRPSPGFLSGGRTPPPGIVTGSPFPTFDNEGLRGLLYPYPDTRSGTANPDPLTWFSTS